MDIKKHHILSRDSRMFMLQSNAYPGFRSLDVLGPKNWEWNTMFRPFLRAGRAIGEPEQTIKPDDYTLKNGENSIRIIRHSKDSMKAIISLPEADRVLMGPCGTFRNFGGNIEQEFLVFNGFQKMAEISAPDTLRSVNNSTVCIVKAASGTWKTNGSGYYIDLPAGETEFGIAIGYENQDNIESIADKALQADTESLTAENAAYWGRLFESIPSETKDQEREKAEEAIWVINGSELAPEGGYTGSSLAAGKPAFSRGMYLWDTSFGVRGYAPIAPESCREWLNGFIERRGNYGQLAGSLQPDTSTINGSQVPIYTWAANAVFENTNDLEFLAKAFEAALVNHRWWMNKGAKECDGLPETSTISYDNSPIYDSLRIKGMATGKTVNPDIIAAVYNDASELLIMAEKLGQEEIARELSENMKFLAAKMHEHLYDPEADFYFSKANGEFIKVKIGPALNAITAAPDDVAARLADKYVRPGSVFWPKWGMATVASDEPSFDPDNYWRGMIWGPTNRLLIDALDRKGLTKQADILADHTLKLFEANDSFYEVFKPDNGMGRRGTHMSGFSAGVYLDLLQRKYRR